MKSPWKLSCLKFIDDCGVRAVLNLYMAENVWSHYFECEHHPNLLGITAARLWVYVSSDQVSLPYPVWPLQLLRECVYLLTYIIISGRELIYYRSYSHGFTATILWEFVAYTRTDTYSHCILGSKSFNFIAQL